MLEGDLSPVLMAGMAAIAVAAAVFALAWPYISGERAKDKRVQDVATMRGGRKLGTGAAAETGSSRKKNVAETLKEIETRQKAKEKITLRLRLQRAGIDISPRDFYVASAICGVLLGGAIHTMTSAPLIGVFTAAFVGALGLPRWYLSKATKKRQNKFLSELANAIALRDKAAVSRTPGVGPKVAERIVTELKDKAPAFASVDPALVHLSGAIDNDRAPRPVTDAISALVNLGYGQPQAAAAIAQASRSAGENAETAQLIRLGLKELAK